MRLIPVKKGLEWEENTVVGKECDGLRNPQDNKEPKSTEHATSVSASATRLGSALGGSTTGTEHCVCTPIHPSRGLVHSAGELSSTITEWGRESRQHAAEQATDPRGPERRAQGSSSAPRSVATSQGLFRPLPGRFMRNGHSQ